MNACEKYYWILNHVAFINPEHINVILDVEPHMVCPVTSRIESYPQLNTKMELWVELMVPLYDENQKKWDRYHDWDLDTGGDTWEHMIEKLYDLVLEKYGPYTEDEHDAKYEEVFNYKISSSMLNPKRRKLAKTWYDVCYKKWSMDILDDDTRRMIEDEIKEVQGTILALTEYRKTCSIEEYAEIDAGLEKENYVLFEQQLSIRLGIDMVRK